jgi:non-specific serine/threonine protein kinase/serine/threonine-protein kinase
VAIAGGAVANAIVQGRRAERHFREVRQLANSFLFEFHDAIAKLPGATPARELVVKRALQYLDGLAGEASNDVDLKRELAESYQRVGDAQGLYYESNLGRDAESLASFQKARTLFAEVLQARPDDERAHVDLAIATLRVSSGYQGRDPARALALMRDAVARLRGIVDRGSPDPRALMALGSGYFGIAEATMGKPDESLRARDESIRIYRGVVASHASAEATRWLSQSLKRRAALYVGPLKDPGRAAPDLAEAATIDERRVALDPSDAVAQMDLALGLGYASVVHRQTGDLMGAIALLNRAMAIRTTILDADPQNARARTLLDSDRQRLAALLAEQARAK